MYTAAKCEWNFLIYNYESISEEKIFTRFSINFSSSEIHFTNQRSNLYWKWRKWLMWGEHKRRNEWKFKNIRRKNQNNKADHKKKPRNLWKWIVIGGNFFIISRINWVTSQFLNINFKCGSRTPALSNVEFIVTGACVTMFLVKLVFILYLSSVVPGIYVGMHLYVDVFLIMVSSKQIFFSFLNLFIFSILFYPNR